MGKNLDAFKTRSHSGVLARGKPFFVAASREMVKGINLTSLITLNVILDRMLSVLQQPAVKLATQNPESDKEKKCWVYPATVQRILEWGNGD